MSLAPDDIHVLHVDDEPEFADLAAEYLEREDDRLAVETAPSASEGLDLLAEHHYDCIVSDYDMPGLDGIEFLDAVREDYPDLPFILFTGKGSEEVASEAIATGVSDYLQKGPGTERYELLASRILSHVERTQAQHLQQQHLDAIETAQEGISILDENGHFTYVNQRFADLYGYEAEEMIGEHWELIYPDEEVETIQEEILPHVEERGYWRGETTGLRANGSTFIEDHTLAQTDEGGLVCTIRDVSERKAREQELERYAAIFDHATDAIALIEYRDETPVIQDANPAFESLFASEDGDITGRDIDEVVASGDRREEAKTISERVREGELVQKQLTRETVDGPRTFDWQIVPVEDRETGEIETAFVIYNDITERLQRQERFQAFVERSTDIVSVLNPDGTYAYQSPAVERILGYNPEAMIGENAFEYVHPEDREDVMETFEQAVADPDATPTVEFRFRHADGSWQWLESRGNNQLENPAIEGFVVNSRDITERKERERELEQKNERLDEFASVISHDLRNPLNVAEGRLELATEDCDSEHLEAVDQALARMATLIEDTLALARAGESIGDTEPVNLPELVDSCWHNVETGKATLVTDTDASIAADVSRLQQLFENLLRNAVEHGGPEVTVTVGDFPDGFYVADDGPGIPEDERGNVLDAGYSTAEEGTGFGLSIVREIAEAHDWEIRVTDSAAGGARFGITDVEVTES